MPDHELTPVQELHEINRKLMLIATAANEIITAKVATEKAYSQAERIIILTDDIMETNTFNLYKYLNNETESPMPQKQAGAS